MVKKFTKEELKKIKAKYFRELDDIVFDAKKKLEQIVTEEKLKQLRKK